MIHKGEPFEFEVKGVEAKIVRYFIKDIILLFRDDIVMSYWKAVLFKYLGKLSKKPLSNVCSASRKGMDIDYWNEGKAFVIRFSNPPEKK